MADTQPATGNGGFRVAPAANVDQSKPTSRPPNTDAPFRIEPLGQRTPYIKILVYGRHGAGKTTLFGSAVDFEPMRDVLLVDAESGDLAIEDNPRIKNSGLISHIRVTSFKQVAYVHQFLKAHCLARDANNVDKLQELEAKALGMPIDKSREPKRYRTVILDSLSEIDQYSLYSLQGLDQSQLLADPDSIDVARFEEFRKNNEMVKMLCRAFRDLPMHVFFSCSSQYTQDERKAMHYTPYMTGKLSLQVQGMMDVVGYMTVNSAPNENGEQDRRLFVQPGDLGGAKFDAKNRRAIFKKPFFDNPTIEMIMRETGMVK